MKLALSLSGLTLLTATTIWFAMGDAPGVELDAPPASAPSLAEPPAQTRTAGPLEATRRVRLPARTFEIGTRHRYDYRSDKSISLGGEGSPAIDIGLSARLDMTPVAREGELVRVQVELSDARLEHDGVPTDHPLRSQLEAPFMVSMSPAGRVEALHVPRGWSSKTRMLVKALVASVQLVLPADAGPRWVSHEEDSTGEYRATYRAARAGDEGPVVHKSKEHYRRIATVDGLQAPAEGDRYTVDGAAEITLGPDGWPTRWRGREAVDAEVGPIAIAYVEQTRLTLIDRRHGPVAALSLWDLDTTAVSGQDATADNTHDLDRQLVGEASFGTLLDVLGGAMDREGAEGRVARGEAALRLAASLRLHPENAAAVGDRVRNAEPSPMTEHLVGVLGAAGTAQSQAELVELATGADVDPAHRVGAVASLGTSDNPTHASRAALTELARNADGDVDQTLQQTATLGLGNLHRKAQEETGEPVFEGEPIADEAEAPSVVTELAAMLQAAPTDHERAVIIDALGNTASAEAFPVLDPIAAVPGTLQEEAVFALRGIPLGGVDARLWQVMAASAVPTQLAALKAIEFRSTPAQWATLGQMMAGGHRAVRSAIVSFAGRRAAIEEGARALLEAAAQGDADPTVREAATGLLGAVAAL